MEGRPESPFPSVLRSSSLSIHGQMMVNWKVISVLTFFILPCTSRTPFNAKWCQDFLIVIAPVKLWVYPTLTPPDFIHPRGRYSSGSPLFVDYHAKSVKKDETSIPHIFSLKTRTWQYFKLLLRVEGWLIKLQQNERLYLIPYVCCIPSRGWWTDAREEGKTSDCVQ